MHFKIYYFYLKQYSVIFLHIAVLPATLLINQTNHFTENNKKSKKLTAYSTHSISEFLSNTGNLGPVVRKIDSAVQRAAILQLPQKGKKQ